MKTVGPWTLLLCLGTAVVAQPPGRTLAPLPIDGAHDLTGKGHAFIDVSAPRDTYFVHEAIPLRLRFGVEDGFLSTSMVQLFPRRLDVPVQVQTPWLERLPGSPPTERGGRELGFAFSDSVAAASAQQRTVDGKQFTVLEIQRTHRADDPGELVIPAPLLRFAYATRFREDFVNGRMGLDRRDAFVRGKKLTLRIQPLPAKGRPPEFTGGVGRFTVHATAKPRDIEVAQSFKLVLHIEGQGNLESLAPPRLDQLAGFHVLGMVDDKSSSPHRTVTWDMAPLNATIKEVPPIVFAFFDPTPPAGYRTEETQPIPLRVRPLPEGARAKLLAADKARRPVPGVNDIFDIKPLAGVTHANASLHPSPAPRWILLLSPLLLVLGIRLWLRSRTPNQGHLDCARARAAAATFRARIDSTDTNTDTDITGALAEFLAALLGCSAAGVITPDLKAQLQARGIPEELATRAASLLESLVAAQYGGHAATASATASHSLVDALVDALVGALEASSQNDP
jgi:hypothetical protein